MLNNTSHDVCLQLDVLSHCIVLCWRLDVKNTSTRAAEHRRHPWTTAGNFTQYECQSQATFIITCCTIRIPSLRLWPSSCWYVKSRLISFYGTVFFVGMVIYPLVHMCINSSSVFAPYWLQNVSIGSLFRWGAVSFLRSVKVKLFIIIITTIIIIRTWRLTWHKTRVFSKVSFEHSQWNCWSDTSRKTVPCPCRHHAEWMVASSAVKFAAWSVVGESCNVDDVALLPRRSSAGHGRGTEVPCCEDGGRQVQSVNSVFSPEPAISGSHGADEWRGHTSTHDRQGIQLHWEQTVARNTRC